MDVSCHKLSFYVSQQPCLYILLQSSFTQLFNMQSLSDGL